MGNLRAGLVAAVEGLPFACAGVAPAGGDMADRPRALCADLSGFEALAWDDCDGVPVAGVAVLPPLLAEGDRTDTHTEVFERVCDTFMTIDWQMLAGDPTDHADREGGGWLERFDAVPDHLSRH